MKIRNKAYAKINLSLNVYNCENGYHNLDSVVSTIDLYDEIIVSKRRDDKINLVMRGIGEDVLSGTDNNAYKAAKLFKETFNTKGVDIKIVSEHLGHSDVGTTANIYTDVLENTRRKTAEIIEFKMAK